MFLIIPHITMTSIGTIQIISLLNLRAHPLHIFRIHRIEFASDGQCGYFYFRKIFGPIPEQQSTACFEFAGTLHGNIDAFAEVFESS